MQQNAMFSRTFAQVRRDPSRRGSVVRGQEGLRRESNSLATRRIDPAFIELDTFLHSRNGLSRQIGDEGGNEACQC